MPKNDQTTVLHMLDLEKVKHTASIRTIHPVPRYLPKRNRIFLYKDLSVNIHRGIAIHSRTATNTLQIHAILCLKKMRKLSREEGEWS